MITKSYKTLRGLISQTCYGKITFNEFKSGKFFHKRLGYIQFKLSESATEVAYKLFSGCVYSRSPESKIHLLRYYRGREYGIFNRLWLTERNSKVRADYCAGQDYSYEVRIIQNILRNGN